MRALLEFHHVSCVRGDRLVFEGLAFCLDPGGALHVTGPNGCGKSSMIRLAAGLLEPAVGSISRSLPVALSDENLALDRELPLGKALSFWSDGIDTALHALGIQHLARVPVRLLSTGQAKKARLARVVASNAPLWLLDEPLNGLDLDGVERLSALIARHRDAGGAVVAASHVPLPGDWKILEMGR